MARTASGVRFRLASISPVLALSGALFFATRLLADEYADLFQSAATHTQHAEYQQAIADYRAALRLRPAAPEAWSNLAVVLYQSGHYAEAYSDASKVWPGHPELKAAALIAGMAAVQNNHPRDAVLPLTTLLTADPKNRDALHALASAYFAQQEFARASTTYETVLAGDEKDVTALYGLAICYERQAEQASARLARMPGGKSLSKLMLAHYLQGTGDQSLARQAFGESASDPEQPSEQAKREYETARLLAAKSQHAFETLVAAAPESWQAAVFLGDVARQHGDFVSALKHYNNALALQPDNPAALLGLATVHWEMGDFEHATSSLRRTLELNPHALPAVFELGNIAVRQHREREAIPLLKQYIDAEPDALAARADLGRAYLHEGRYQEAAAQLARAASSDEQGDIHYQLSLALKKLGQDAKARAALEESTRLREQRLQKQQQQHALEQASQ